MESETKKIYSKILKLARKYKDICVFDVADMENKARLHLFGLELVEKYGFNINPKSIRSTDWQELKANVFIGFWDGERRKISWPNDGSQPSDETLLCFKYPTGAYIFGGDYPVEFFQKFFLELISYGPKYIDNANKSLYFSLDNAGVVFNTYDSLIKKYYDENKKDIKQRQIKKMKEDLAKLEAK